MMTHLFFMHFFGKHLLLIACADWKTRVFVGMFPLVFLKRKALLLLPLKVLIKWLVDTGEKSPIAAVATA